MNEYSLAKVQYSNSINTPSVYDTTGRRVQKWKKGLNIIRKKDGTTRKVVVK